MRLHLVDDQANRLSLRLGLRFCGRTARVAACFLSLLGTAMCEEKSYSGPQPGERTTPFKSVELRGEAAGKDRDIIAELKGAPTALIFVHGVERSMAPLLTVLDEYAQERKDLLKAEFVFLSGDRLGSQQRLPLVGQSLRLKAPM